MRALFSTTVISSDNLAVGRAGFGSQWNGQPVVDVVQFFRAANAVVYGRADGPETFSLSVWAFFGSEADALTFCTGHRAALPLQADLVLIDHEETVALRLANAVRTVVINQRIGLAVLVQYSFTGARFLTEDVPDAPEDIDLVKYGTATPAAAAESIAIVFGTPFGSEPRFFVLTLEPAAGQPAIAVLGYGSITAAGFTAILAAALPTTGYIARWKAEL